MRVVWGAGRGLRSGARRSGRVQQPHGAAVLVLDRLGGSRGLTECLVDEFDLLTRLAHRQPAQWVGADARRCGAIRNAGRFVLA